ncbi:MAG TPA: hypothetical protein VNI84_05630 [Pyrinomonadaceae bacterium]|nr:hypothetical protein [Pyrinomonadaceae bacterium]
MISQSCPRCHSKRIRRGYRPTSLWSKILFRYNLLCNACNWEFKGFAVPGTVSVKPTKKRKTDEGVVGKPLNISSDGEEKLRVKNRVKVKL